MAIFRNSIIVPSISGKVGGITLQTGGKSPILRLKTTPRPRTTPAALAHKVRYQHLTHDWRALTDGERDTWNALATQTRFTNRLGLPRNPSGRELFFREFLIQTNSTVPYGPIPTASTLTPPPTALTFPIWTPVNLVLAWTQPPLPLQTFSAIYAHRTVKGTPRTIKPNLPYVERAGSVPGTNIILPMVLTQGTPIVGEYIQVHVRVRATNHLWSAITGGQAQVQTP